MKTSIQFLKNYGEGGIEELLSVKISPSALWLKQIACKHSNYKCSICEFLVLSFRYFADYHEQTEKYPDMFGWATLNSLSAQLPQFKVIVAQYESASRNVYWYIRYCIPQR